MASKITARMMTKLNMVFQGFFFSPRLLLHSMSSWLCTVSFILGGPDIRITMPTAPLSAQIGMKESRQTVAFLVELNLRRKHTTTHGRRSRRLLPELKTV